MTVALLTEAYRSYGMDYFSAIHAAQTVGIPEEEKPKPAEPAPEVNNDQAMNQLMGMIGGTGKKFGA